MKREPGGRRAFPESSQPATPAANAAEIVTLALNLSATAAAVAEAQRPSLGWRNIHSRHRLTEAYYYIVGARLGRRGVIRIWRVRKNAKVQICPKTLVHDCRFWALQVAVAVVSSQSSIRKLIEWAGFTSSLVSFTSFKDPKNLQKVKNYSRKSHWFKNHAKVNAYFTDHEKIENQFPEDGNI